MSEALLPNAYQLHQAGNIEDAIRLYRDVLRASPRNFDAVRLLGLAYFQTARFDDAERLAGEAGRLNPGSPEPPFLQGCALKKLNRLPEAVLCFDRALAIHPDHAPARNNRGVSLLAMGRFTEALDCFDGAAAPDNAPEMAAYNRATALLGLKRHAEALQCCDEALAFAPYSAELLYSRGAAQDGLNAHEDALASFDAALALHPSYGEAHEHRAVTLSNVRRFGDALAALDDALAAQPGKPDTLYNRGCALIELQRPAEALAAFDAVLALRPNHGDAWNNRGLVLGQLGRDEDALQSYSRALAINPGNAEARTNRGNLLLSHSRYDEADADYEAAATIDPGFRYGRGNLAYCRLDSGNWNGLETLRTEIAQDVRAGRRTLSPGASLALLSSAEEQFLCARLWAAHECPPARHPLWQGERYTHDKIRIAYLSANFNGHATSHLITGLCDSHDREHFEIIAISFSPDDRTAMRTQVTGAFDRFVDVRGMTDLEAARLIREMEIDIAVDLMGYIKDSRMGILAHRPAPVQVSWLGFAGTMGADFIDYMIADRTVIPESDQRFYSEKIAYLPDTYQSNDLPRRTLGTAPTRADAGLPGDGFVFCSFNATYKITPEFFGIWMRLLNAVPGSVLWLLETDPVVVRNLSREAQARGVAPERLVFAPRLDIADHLARHALADLFLDTLPYNAHTTASDALWMNVPVVTCIGNSFAGRVAASLLNAAGMPELVTPSLGAYETLALKLASDPAALDAVKKKLARSRESSALFDTVRFTRNMEAAYGAMCERQRGGEPPGTIG